MAQRRAELLPDGSGLVVNADVERRKYVADDVLRDFAQRVHSIGSIWECYVRGELGFHLDLWCSAEISSVPLPDYCVLIERAAEMGRDTDHVAVSEGSDIEPRNDWLCDEGGQKPMLIIVVELGEMSERMLGGVFPNTAPLVRLDAFDHTGVDGMDSGERSSRTPFRVRPAVLGVVREDWELDPRTGALLSKITDESPREMIKGGSQVVYCIPKLKGPELWGTKVSHEHSVVRGVGLKVDREGYRVRLSNVEQQVVRVRICPTELLTEAAKQRRISKGRRHGA